MENNSNKIINPYEPPKFVSTKGEPEYSLNKDSYDNGNELVTNEHFKSPLIYAMLGISVQHEEQPHTTKITIERKPFLPKVVYLLVISVLLGLLYLIISYRHSVYSIASSVAVLALIPLLIRLLTKPAQIIFYLSKEYLSKRKLRIIIFSSILILFIISGTLGLITGSQSLPIWSLFGLIIVASIFKLAMNTIVVIKSKNGYHYLHGTHKNLLENFPPLPQKEKPHL